MRKFTQLVLACLCLYFTTSAQSTSTFIHIDQFGYLPDATKVAVLSNPIEGYNSNLSYSPSAQLEVRNADTDAIVFTAAPITWNNGAIHSQSGDQGWWFDFSDLHTPGSYYIFDPQQDERSATFEINEKIYEEVLKAASRMFFYNRCGMAKTAPFAESNWTDGPSFSQDAQARYYFDQNNTALQKDMSGGWFDAGDYNKYVTFANSAIHDLLWAYRENPDAFADDWNIPESGNDIPDILDEVKWELDWLFKMNNPDGSTHIKMGSISYDDNANTPPSTNTDTRYYGPTCTSASLAVAGMFAHAALVYQEVPGMEDFASQLRSRAISAWDYVIPKILAGEFDENCDNGEILSGDADWYSNEQIEQSVVAAVHLYELTGEASYNEYFINHYDATEPVAGGFWGPYKLPLIDALLWYTTLPGANNMASTLIKNSFAFDAFNNWNGYFGFTNEDLYRAQIPDWSYHWGSNKTKADYGNLNLLLSKHNMDTEQSLDYQLKASELLHYFHGVNPLGLVYLTNMYSLGAERSVNEIYHAWFADETQWDNAQSSTAGPPPGFLSGGANPAFTVAALSPPAGQPAQKSYLDFNDNWPYNSWEISEPAIYYQAAYIRLLSKYVTEENTPTNTNEVEMADLVQIFPNPTKDQLQVQTNFDEYSWQLLDISGKIISSKTSKKPRSTITMKHLPAGTYFLRITDKYYGTTLTEKVVKQ